MEKVAVFEKVSFQEFQKSCIETLGDMYSTSELKEIYQNIRLPKRATNGSAGYDFCCPFELNVKKDEKILIPTGIRVQIKDGWMLSIFPRSGLGFKHKFQIFNTIGIIDSDYYFSDNQGHIMLKFIKDDDEIPNLHIKALDNIVQGVFLPFGVTENDEQEKKSIRNGGFGSTNNK